MNLGELRTAVRRRANVPATDGVWTDAFVDEAVNEALQIISVEQPWPWLEAKASFAGGTNPVDLSALVPLVRDIATVFVDTYEAQPVSTSDIDGWDRIQGERSRYVFSTWADQLLIEPEPTAANTVLVRYYRNEPILTGTSDTPLMPAVYHYAIVHAACAAGFTALDDESSAQLHEGRARQVVARMTVNALNRRRGPRVVRVRPGSMI